MRFQPSLVFLISVFSIQNLYASEAQKLDLGIQQRPEIEEQYSGVSISESVEKSKKTSNVVSPRFQFELGSNLHQFDYAEEVKAPLKSTEKGLIKGYMAKVRIQKEDSAQSSYGFLEGKYSSTNLVYDGSTQTGKPLTHDGQHQFIALKASAGVPFANIGDGSAFLEFGVGYDQWSRGEAGMTSSGALGYRELYKQTSVNAGLKLDLYASKSFSFTPYIGGKLPVFGEMTVVWSEISSDLKDSSMNLGSALGGRAELGFKYWLGKNIGFSTTPFAEYSAIGESNTVGVYTTSGTRLMSIKEPSSRTFQYGSQIGLMVGI